MRATNNLNSIWTDLIANCNRRKARVEKIVHRTIYGRTDREILTCDDEVTCATRKAICRELICQGYTTNQVASVVGITARQVRRLNGERKRVGIAPALVGDSVTLTKTLHSQGRVLSAQSFGNST